MAQVRVTVDRFAEGDFPRVCCKTGEPSAFRTEWTFSTLPGWTWLLLFFGVIPFLVAALLASREAEGTLPMSERGLVRLRTARRVSLILFGGAVLSLVAALAAGDAVQVPLAMGLALGFGAFTALVLAHAWSPNGDVARDGRSVRLYRVHPAFAAAVRERVEAERRTPDLAHGP